MVAVVYTRDYYPNPNVLKKAGSGEDVPQQEASRLLEDGTVVLLASGGGAGAPLVPGVWRRVPSIFRLRITGTGSCVMASRDSLGNVTEDVETFDANGATDQIEFPYAGDNAVEIRVDTTGSCSVEVL